MKVLCSGELYTEPIEHVECLACALDHSKYGKPPCGFSYPLLKALFLGQEADKRKTEIHVSDLIGCLLKAYFDKAEPKADYVHAKLVLMMGIAVHDYIERALEDDPNMQSEVAVSDIGIEGRVDIVDGANIMDIKTTRWLDPNKQLPYGNHTEQVNAYRTLMGLDGDLSIQYIDMSGPPRCRSCQVLMVKVDGQVQCPNCGYKDRRNHLGAMIVDVEAYNKEEVRLKLQQRQQILAQAMETNALPDAEPGWLCSYCNHLDHCPVGQIYVEAK